MWNVELLLTGGGVRAAFLATEIRQKQHSDLVKTFNRINHSILKYCVEPNCTDHADMRGQFSNEGRYRLQKHNAKTVAKKQGTRKNPEVKPSSGCNVSEDDIDIGFVPLRWRGPLFP